MKKIISAVFAILMLVALSVPAFAGDGSGGGSGIAFDLDRGKSSIPDGEKDVKLDIIIQLSFNKNAVNATTVSVDGLTPMDNNRQNIYMTDPSGNRVYVRLYFPDDQIQSTSEYKRNIFVVPGKNLKSNTNYTLVLTSNICAKNGTRIAKPYSFTFTTGSSTGATNSDFFSIGVASMKVFDVDGSGGVDPTRASVVTTTKHTVTTTVASKATTAVENTTKWSSAITSAGIGEGETTTIFESTTLGKTSDATVETTTLPSVLDEKAPQLDSSIQSTSPQSEYASVGKELAIISPWVIIILGRYIFITKIGNKFN